VLLAAAVALPLAAFGPPPGDLPAHLYRAELVRAGVLVWDTFWFAGHYPLASYSLLYYFPAALVGNDPLAVAAVVASAALFASIAERAWGARTRWAARVFAVAACGSLFTGTYSYAAGVAAGLGTLRALQAGRTWVAVLCAALTLGFSPLAFLFLVLVLVAAFLARPRVDRRALVVGTAVVLLAGLQGAAVIVFRHDATYPFFQVGELVAVVVFGVVCGLLTARASGGRTLALVCALWVVASVVAFLVHSPVGENVTRLRGFAFPLGLAAAALGRYRPRLLAAVAVVGGLAFTLVPYVAVIPRKLDARPAEEAFWRPALGYLHARIGPGERIEVVPTGDHWEAYWLPRAGIPITRGWYRQLDVAENELFYQTSLDPAAYRAWLRRLGVAYVLLPDTQLGHLGEDRQAALLRSGRAGLRPVHSSATGTIYAVPDVRPILSGPGRARLTRLDHDRVDGRVEAPGLYRLAVRFMPYWRDEHGAVCVAEAPDGMTLLRARLPGAFALRVSLGGGGAC
jgi:hypothetical protein